MKKSELKKLIREEILKEEIDLRKAFYSLSDSIIGFSETIKGEQFTGDSTIVEMNTQLNGILDKILNHLNINYKG